MDIGILLGVVGIAVSIAAGFLTFAFTDRKTKAARWRHAKMIVLQDLSKSLGDGEVPSAEVIEATIRSVLREQNAADLTAVTLDEVVDDLLRSVTSDPFLDSTRCVELQAQLLALTQSEPQLHGDGAEAPSPRPQTSLARRRSMVSLLSGVVTGFLATLLASVAFFAATPVLLDQMRRLSATLEDTPLALQLVMLTAPAMFIMLAVLYIIVARVKQERERHDHIERIKNALSFRVPHVGE